MENLRQPAAMRPLTNAELDDVNGGLVAVSDGAFRLALGPVGLAIGIRADILAGLVGH